MKPTDRAVIFCGAVYYAVQRGFQFGSMSTIRPWLKLSQRAPLVPGGGGGGGLPYETDGDARRLA